MKIVSVSDLQAPDVLYLCQHLTYILIYDEKHQLFIQRGCLLAYILIPYVHIHLNLMWDICVKLLHNVYYLTFYTME